MRGGMGAIRLDPVKSRVALPAADPPDNANDLTGRPRDIAAASACLLRVSLMNTHSTLRRDWLSNIRGDVLSGIVVALALIPRRSAFP